MRLPSLLVGVGLLFWTASAHSQDNFSVTGDVDLRWVHATGESSYLNGGLGILRFDPRHEDLEFGRAFLASNLRITDTVTAHATIDAYGDNPADLSQLYIDIRPFPTTSVRWRARVGAFFMPVSL